MQQPIAYQNGQIIPQDQLCVPPQDLGFMWGVTVAEQLRTFRGQLFLLNEHLQRLVRGLEVIEVAVSQDEIAEAAQEVVRHNYSLIDPKSDLGLTIFVTPGLSPTYRPEAEARPTVGIHSYPLPFVLWANKYEVGQICDWSTVRQVSSACWPRGLKSRSRMHYYLADLEVRSRQPTARAILLDEEGYVNEASTANVVAYFAREGFVSPPLENILPGVSLQFLASLACNNNEAFTYRRVTSAEFASADEILLTSTPFCLLPVARVGAREYLERGQFSLLLDRWSEHVGVDIAAQALS